MITTTLANAILDALLGASATTALVGSSIEIGLLLAAPNADGTGVTEPSGGSYARVVVVNNGTNFPAAANGLKTCATDITFATAAADWGTITHVGIFNAITHALKLSTPLSIPRSINSGDIFKFVAAYSPLSIGIS